MNLNRTELRKITYDFNCISSRLLQANYEDYIDVVRKFISFVKSTPIIYDYIIDCGSCNFNLDDEFSQIAQSYGRCIFSTGNTNEEEVSNVFAVLDYLAQKDTNTLLSVVYGYASSNQYQDKVKAFNARYVMILLRHIESYLTKIGIDMGLDEKIKYSITVSNGQVNIANDSATITAENNVCNDLAEFDKLIKNIRNLGVNITGEDAEILYDNLDVIEEQIKSGKPKNGFIKTAINGIKSIKGTTEFIAAVAELAQLLKTIM